MNGENSNVKRAMLVILDGFGVKPDGQYNAILKADMPRLDEYFTRYPSTTLEASGPSVGLPEGQMGNSEVGHITLGCGCIIRQDLVRIHDAIKDGSFFRKSALVEAMQSAKKHDRPIHLMGLVSDGGVHSHLSHVIALIQMAKSMGVVPWLHMITDGRDTAPKSAMKYLEQLLPELADAQGRVATVIGRYYAMDRDNRWDRTQLAWNAIVRAEGKQAESAEAAIKNAYSRKETDEFITPTIIQGFNGLLSNDAIIFFNFRNDRPRQIAAALAQNEFSGFERGDYAPCLLTTMTVYDDSIPARIAFGPEQPQITLSAVVSQAGYRQFHCAETEKYPHVTFFLNGGQEDPLPGEDRVVVPSPKVATYDLQPEMSAPEVADAIIDSLQNPEYKFIVVNFANGDMVGHTANEPAIIQALEAMDTQVGRILDAAVENDVSVLLTADHGNCDEVIDAKTGEPHTQHTTNPVPCLIVSGNGQLSLKSGQGLSAVAPTMLKLMHLPKPEQMTGEELY